MDVTPKYVEDLHTFLRTSSVTRLSHYTKLNTIQLVNPQEAPSIPGHWMGIILLAGGGIRIMLKSFYLTSHIRALTENFYNETERILLSPNRTHDFIKEFNNLVGGALKLALDRQNLATGISLPVVTRGFDDIFSVKTDETFKYKHFWKIGLPNAYLTLVSAIQITDPTIIKNFNLKDAESVVQVKNEIETL